MPSIFYLLLSTTAFHPCFKIAGEGLHQSIRMEKSNEYKSDHVFITRSKHHCSGPLHNDHRQIKADKISAGTAGSQKIITQYQAASL